MCVGSRVHLTTKYTTMSYKPITNDDFERDLLRRKEMYSLKGDSSHDYRSSTDIYVGKYLKLRSYQLFVRGYQNPNTPYKRLHLMFATGAGKTLAGCAVAAEFIKAYQKLYTINTTRIKNIRKNRAELDMISPTIFVLGFGGTKAAFIRELLTHPEFGFITVGEKDELRRRQGLVASGLPDDIKHYKEYFTFLKKRITNKSRGGFYKFFGYDEFVNRLFLGRTDSTGTIKLVDLDAEFKRRVRTEHDLTLEAVFAEYIADGRIQVNTQMLTMFENSLLLCDEFHNTYNTGAKNNRGIAIQYLLDHVETLRLLSLSATTINNSPMECIEHVNYLISGDHAKITKKDFFIDRRTFRPGKLEELGRLTRGYISFLQDISIKYYPERVFLGETLRFPGPAGGYPTGAEIPYLKFVPCAMSDFHQLTYNHYVEVTSVNAGVEDMDVDEPEDVDVVIDLDEPPHAVPTDGYSIYDIAIPNPDLGGNDTTPTGIFRSSDIRSKLSAAPQSWKDAHKITLKKTANGVSIITGDFLRAENIGKYSTKYAELLKIIFEIVAESSGDPSKCQKIMIYHDRKIMSGAYMIQELLYHNGILDEYSDAIDSTICCICGKMLSEHAQAHVSASLDITALGVDTDAHVHTFTPLRFVMAHSDIDKSIMDASLSKYNAPDNRNGTRFMILVGSKIIKESYDFKDIQNLIMTSLPTNIPTMIQVFGRAIRTNSHINLPLDQRKVKIRILLTTNSTRIPAADPVSPEMHRYADKLADYTTIQLIEREYNRNAIDGDLHRDIIMPADLKATYESSAPTLGNLYYEPKCVIPDYKPEDLNTTTFTAYEHYRDEIRTISYLIKRLFTMCPVWTYDQLLTAVRAPPIGVEVNPALFDENNFIIALHNLISTSAYVDSGTATTNPITTSVIVDQLFDTNEKRIYAPMNKQLSVHGEVHGDITANTHSQYHRIKHIGNYYILFPLDTVTQPPHLVADVETYMRHSEKKHVSRISINSYLNDDKKSINYTTNRSKFLSEYSSLMDTTEISTIDLTVMYLDYPEDFQKRFLEEAIMSKYAGSATTTNSKLYDRILDIMAEFNAIVKVSEIIKYKDTTKHYKEGPPKNTSLPGGYESAKVIRLYDPEGEGGSAPGQWFEINKLAMNRHITYKENNTIIGYYEQAGDEMRFKLRKPVQILRQEVTTDTRFLERGMVCTTRTKQNLLEILAGLGVSISKISEYNSRVRNLCEILKRRLIELELKERRKDTMYKYLYSWWSTTPNIITRQ